MFFCGKFSIENLFLKPKHYVHHLEFIDFISNLFKKERVDNESTTPERQWSMASYLPLYNET
jgi:hypothetical protein